MTDARVLLAVGGGATDGSDWSVSIPHAGLQRVGTGRGMLTRAVTLTTENDAEWWFAVRGRDDLDPVVSYLRRARSAWARVERRLGDARRHLAAVDDPAVEDPREAVATARNHIEDAKEVAAEFEGGPGGRLGDRIAGVEAKLRRARMRGNVRLGRRRAREAERSWRDERFEEAYDAYVDARERYERALSVAEEVGADEVTGILERLDGVETHLEHLASSPLQRARRARDHAEAATDPAVAVDRWETALSAYRTAVVVDWGRDRRFAGDPEELREAVERAVDEVIERRYRLARRHRSAGDARVFRRYHDRARIQYRTARQHLDNGLSVAEEFRPERARRFRERITELDRRLDYLDGS